MFSCVYNSVSFVDYTIAVKTAVVRYRDIPPIHLLVSVCININTGVAERGSMHIKFGYGYLKVEAFILCIFECWSHVYQMREFKLILPKTFTTGLDWSWILWPCWFVNVPMIVFAVVIKDGTCVHWWRVIFKAFIRILRSPNDIWNVISN